MASSAPDRLAHGIWPASVGLARDGVTDHLLAQGAAVGPVAAGTIRVP